MRALGTLLGRHWRPITPIVRDFPPRHPEPWRQPGREDPSVAKPQVQPQICSILNWSLRSQNSDFWRFFGEGTREWIRYFKRFFRNQRSLARFCHTPPLRCPRQGELALSLSLITTIQQCWEAWRPGLAAQKENIMTVGTAMHEAPVISLECHDCAGADLHMCDDCPVAFLLGRESDDAIVFDALEERALRLLAEGGLLDEVVSRKDRSGSGGLSQRREPIAQTA